MSVTAKIETYILHKNKIATNVFHIDLQQHISFIMNSLLEQIKIRRKALALKQHDMMLRIGMSRQQYQRLESKGNPRLDTLELIAMGLKSKLLLIPQEKLSAVLAILEEDSTTLGGPNQPSREKNKSLADDPWQGLLGETE
jgi:transcriptional regulator with XRE-family HTH domain